VTTRVTLRAHPVKIVAVARVSLSETSGFSDMVGTQSA